MKSIKRLIAGMLAFVVFASMFPVNAFAEEPEVISISKRYEILDMEGNQLEEFSQMPDQTIVKRYSATKTVIVVETTETVTKRGLDVTKSVEEEFNAHFASGTTTEPNAHGIDDTSGDVRWKLRASITYNPNTFKISYATKAVRTFIHSY